MRRLLGACLHQAIAEQLPDRLDFYEHWLQADTWRGGEVGPAALGAVTGFLRTEGPAYEHVMTTAGTLAAAWHLESLSSARRRLIGWLPGSMRARAATRLAVALIGSTSTPTRASRRHRGQQVHLKVGSSVFCRVRERPEAPLCGFYLAVMVETLRHFGVAAHGRVERCHAMDEGECSFVVDLDGAASASAPAMAA